jgi:hypothetical protein
MLVVVIEPTPQCRFFVIPWGPEEPIQSEPDVRSQIGHSTWA